MIEREEVFKEYVGNDWDKELRKDAFDYAWQARGVLDAVRIKELEDSEKWWQSDSAAGWDKCEERRLENAELTAKLDKAKEALKCIDDDLINPVHYILVKEALQELDK